jgi:hypothetical protein
MTPRNPPFEFRYLPTGQGWYAYQIVRRTDMALIAGGECRSQRAAVAEAKRHAARLLNPPMEIAA